MADVQQPIIFSLSHSKNVQLTSYIFWQWFRRDFLSRYRGTVIGTLWPVVQPLAQMLVFTLVFHEFFGMRWPHAHSNQHSAIEYGINVFVGLAVFTYFSEVLNRSPHALLAQPNLITKVKFPLLILPAVTVALAALHILIATALVLPFSLSSAHVLGLLLLPAWLAPLVLYGLGLAWCLSALNLYLRDIGHSATPVSNLILFLSPVFYPASTIPTKLAWINSVNPIAWASELLRGLLMRGQWPDPSTWLIHLTISLLIAWTGMRLFNRLKPGFSDVI